jgi:hypothetical protein
MIVSNIYQVFIIALTIGLWIFMKKKGYKNVTRKFILLFIGVLLFEFMTEPMWVISSLWSWTFIFRDISFILTLNWINAIMISILIVDYAFYDLPEKRRFWMYLLFVTGIMLPLEIFLNNVGILGHATELLARTAGINIPLSSIPIEAIFVLPIFGTLIITFYKYTNYLMDQK